MAISATWIKVLQDTMVASDEHHQDSKVSYLHELIYEDAQGPEVGLRTVARLETRRHPGPPTEAVPPPAG